jgi:hypothetical protein
MARGTQLLQLVEMLRAETGRSDNVSAGRNEETSLKRRLRATQELLYQAYDWPFLKIEATKDLAAGQRHYDWPVTINPDRLTDKIKLRWQNSWYPIERGIGANEYNSYDSINDERTDPALRFEVRAVGASSEQIEIWPIPASNDQVLYFWGLRPLRPLTENTHVADLDDNLIVWTLAAKLLARQKSPDAKQMSDQAATLYSKLTGNSQGGGQNLSLLDGQRNPRVVGTIIRVA